MWPITVSPGGRFLRQEASKTNPSGTSPTAAGGRSVLDERVTQGSVPCLARTARGSFPAGVAYLDPLFARQAEAYEFFDLTTMPPRRIELTEGELMISPDGRRYAAAQRRAMGRTTKHRHFLRVAVKTRDRSYRRASLTGRRIFARQPVARAPGGTKRRDRVRLAKPIPPGDPVA